MKNFRNIVYSETPPNINDLWLKGTLDPDDPFEIRIFKMGKWEIIDKGNLTLEDDTGYSENVTMTQKAITEALDNLQVQIDNINPNDFDWTIEPIEKTKATEGVSVEITIQPPDNESQVMLCGASKNGEGECVPLSKGENTITVNIGEPYKIGYIKDGIRVERDIIFNTTNPLFFGTALKIDDITSENLSILEKRVLDTYDYTYPYYENKYDQHFYIIVPQDKNVYLTSNGFYIPLKNIKTQEYLDTNYIIYESGLLEEGPITNLNIKIIKK